MRVGMPNADHVIGWVVGVYCQHGEWGKYLAGMITAMGAQRHLSCVNPHISGCNDAHDVRMRTPSPILMTFDGGVVLSSSAMVTPSWLLVGLPQPPEDQIRRRQPSTNCAKESVRYLTASPRFQ